MLFEKLLISSCGNGNLFLQLLHATFFALTERPLSIITFQLEKVIARRVSE